MKDWESAIIVSSKDSFASLRDLCTYDTARNAQILVKVLVNENDNSGEEGMQDHGHDDHTVYCPLDKAEGEWPSVESC